MGRQSQAVPETIVIIPFVLDVLENECKLFYIVCIFHFE